MKKRISMLIVLCLLGTTLLPAQSSDMVFPVRGLCIAAPQPESIDRFITFINDEMAPRQVNTLILRVDFNYRFAMKGLRVATCPWNRPEVAVRQVEDMARFRQHASPEMQERFAGIIQTVWSNAEGFMDEFYAKENGEQSSATCFKAVFEKMKTP